MSSGRTAGCGSAPGRWILRVTRVGQAIRWDSKIRWLLSHISKPFPHPMCTYTCVYRYVYICTHAVRAKTRHPRCLQRVSTTETTCLTPSLHCSVQHPISRQICWILISCDTLSQLGYPVTQLVIETRIYSSDQPAPIDMHQLWLIYNLLGPRSVRLNIWART